MYGETPTHLSLDIAEFKQSKYITIIHLTKDAMKATPQVFHFYLFAGVSLWIVYSPGAVDMFKNIEKSEKSNVLN